MLYFLKKNAHPSGDGAKISKKKQNKNKAKKKIKMMPAMANKRQQIKSYTTIIFDLPTVFVEMSVFGHDQLSMEVCLQRVCSLPLFLTLTSPIHQKVINKKKPTMSGEVAAAEAAKPEQLSQEQLQMKYSYLKQEYDQYAQKIAEMDNEKHEHQLVLKALEPLEATRKCYRSINGVLVERTADQVIPTIKDSIEKLDEVLQKLNAQAASKNKELQDFVEEHNVSAKQSAEQAEEQPKEKKEKSAGGVLA